MIIRKCLTIGCAVLIAGLVTGTCLSGSGHCKPPGPPAPPAGGPLYSFTFSEFSLRKYTPLQIQALMGFKPAPLLTGEEKKRFQAVYESRSLSLKEMESAVEKGKPRQYYDAMKSILMQAPSLESAVKKAKSRLGDAREKLAEDFEPFGEKPDKWPAPAKAEDAKLKKGRELVGKFLKVDDYLTRYIQGRARATYEICVIDPDTFTLNRPFLETGFRAVRDFNGNYRKLLDALEEADRKARKAIEGR
ncbi:MAG: hypothetical protein RDV48_14790 [Candidatus Eremiobacteraeota bacterium]|nr:hypothetical protein [Candidatus Eremiobacteraeota bacterium]